MVGEEPHGIWSTYRIATRRRSTRNLHFFWMVLLDLVFSGVPKYLISIQRIFIELYALAELVSTRSIHRGQRFPSRQLHDRFLAANRRDLFEQAMICREL